MCRNLSVPQLTSEDGALRRLPERYSGLAAGRAIRCSRQVAGWLIGTETGQSEPAWTTENTANDHDPFSAASKCPESSHAMSHHRHEPTVVADAIDLHAVRAAGLGGPSVGSPVTVRTPAHSAPRC